MVIFLDEIVENLNFKAEKQLKIEVSSQKNIKFLNEMAENVNFQVGKQLKIEIASLKRLKN